MFTLPRQRQVYVLYTLPVSTSHFYETTEKIFQAHVLNTLKRVILFKDISEVILAFSSRQLKPEIGLLKWIIHYYVCKHFRKWFIGSMSNTVILQQAIFRQLINWNFWLCSRLQLNYFVNVTCTWSRRIFLKLKSTDNWNRWCLGISINVKTKKQWG